MWNPPGYTRNCTLMKSYVRYIMLMAYGPLGPLDLGLPCTLYVFYDDH